MKLLTYSTHYKHGLQFTETNAEQDSKTTCHLDIETVLMQYVLFYSLPYLPC